MSYNIKYQNKIMVPSGDTLNIRELPGTSSKIITTIKKGSPAGRTSGDFLAMKDGNWYMVTFYKTINGKQYGYAREDVFKIVNPSNDILISEKDSQDIVNKLVSSDIQVYNRILKLAPILSNLRNIPEAAQHLETYRNLVIRLNTRQAKLKNNKTLVETKSGLQKGYDSLLTGFKNFISSIFGVGELISLSTIVILAVVIAGTATACYFIFKPSYTESTQDLKISADLEYALSKIDPKKADAIKKDLEKQIDKAYSKGESSGTFPGFISAFKWIAIATGTYIIIQSFKPKKKNDIN